MADKTINIGYFGYNTKSWMGGINYLKNHLIALNSSKQEQDIKPIVFFNEHHDPEIRNIFETLATCVVLSTKSPLPFILKIIDKISKKRNLYFIRYYLKKYNIHIISQSEIEIHKLPLKSIGWIPDFQHLHLPQLFSANEIKEREIKYKNTIEHSTTMIVSSYDCLKDLESFYPGAGKKTKVLHFVAQIDLSIFNKGSSYENEIFKKYNINKRYFFLPNKFYKHKNHLIVFEALNELKKEIPEIQLICTGDFSAYESEDHVLGIKNYLEENDLKSNIKILGVINFNDVQILLKNALSVINPSLFEGWSTTVEECKILDKHIILSNIPVHIEQNPKRSEYFDPKNKIELISILKKRWSDHEKDYKVINSNVLNKSLSKLTKEFGEKYASIIKDTYYG